MKLIFKRDGGIQFEMDIGHDDSLEEIKEKVQTNQGIPISKQTLIFNGIILRDELDLIHAEINDGSLIHLQIAAENQLPRPEILDPFAMSPPQINDADFSDFVDQFNLRSAADAAPQEILVMLKMPAASKPINVKVDVSETIQQLKGKIQEMAKTPIGRIVMKHQNGMELADHVTLLECQKITVEFRPPAEKMDLHLKIAGSNGITVQTCVEDTVLLVKEKIHEKEGTPIGQISITNENGMELPDHKTLHDCAISLDSGITVEFLRAPRKKRKSTSSSSQPAPPPTPTPTPMNIVLQYREVRRTVEVRAAQRVSELRTKVERLRVQVPDQYFFIHNQRVMDEEFSLQWHNVAQGDVILIFPGYVTGGD